MILGSDKIEEWGVDRFGLARHEGLLRAQSRTYAHLYTALLRRESKKYTIIRTLHIIDDTEATTIFSFLRFSKNLVGYQN